MFFGDCVLSKVERELFCTHFHTPKSAFELQLLCNFFCTKDTENNNKKGSGTVLSNWVDDFPTELFIQWRCRISIKQLPFTS
jgi:hypothetical protein